MGLFARGLYIHLDVQSALHIVITTSMTTN